jgi:hypothetical protein
MLQVSEIILLLLLLLKVDLFGFRFRGLGTTADRILL